MKYLQILKYPKKLKDGIKRLYQRHVQNAVQAQAAASKAREKEEAAAAAMAAALTAAANGVSSSSADATAASAASAASSTGFKAAAAVDDVHTDYQRQRHYLERSIDSHNAKCKKDMRVHIKEHTRIMQENISLTKEVNELRREKYHILVQQKSKDQAKATKPGATAATVSSSTAGGLAQRGRMSRTLNDFHDSSSNNNGGSSSTPSGLSGGPMMGDETEIQQEQIRALKRQLHMLETEYQELVSGGGGGGSSSTTTMPSIGGSLAISNAFTASSSSSSSALSSSHKALPPATASPSGLASARGTSSGGLSSRLLHGSDKLPQLSFRNSGSSSSGGTPSGHASITIDSGASSSRRSLPRDRDEEDEEDAIDQVDSALENWNLRNDEEQKE